VNLDDQVCVAVLKSFGGESEWI